jgi:hypothetical protein
MTPQRSLLVTLAVTIFFAAGLVVVLAAPPPGRTRAGAGAFAIETSLDDRP